MEFRQKLVFRFQSELMCYFFKVCNQIDKISNKWKRKIEIDLTRRREELKARKMHEWAQRSHDSLTYEYLVQDWRSWLHVLSFSKFLLLHSVGHRRSAQDSMLNYAKARKLSCGTTSSRCSRMLKLSNSLFPPSKKLKVKSAMCCRLLRSIALLLQAEDFRSKITEKKTTGKNIFDGIRFSRERKVLIFALDDASRAHRVRLKSKPEARRRRWVQINFFPIQL